MKKNKWHGYGYVLLSFLAAGQLLAGCSSTPVESATQEVKAVAAYRVVEQKLDNRAELAGTLEPAEEATVSFEVSGKIVSLHKEQGEAVQAGEALGKLDDTDYKLEVARAEGALMQAKSALDEVENGATDKEIERAQTQVDSARIRAEKAQDDFNKAKELYEGGAVPEDTYDNAQTQLKLAQKELNMAEVALAQLKDGARPEDREQTKSVYEQQVALKEKAESALAKTELVSPFSGTVIDKLADEGQTVSAGTPVYRIGRVDELKVVLPVPDRDIASWKVGGEVRLDLYGAARTGHIRLIEPATNENTGTIGVEVRIDNADRGWFVGQVVRATYVVPQGQALLVPVESVVNSGVGDPYVFVVQDGKAVKRPVGIGQVVGGMLEIKSGVKAGETVVAKGADRLYDGDALEVVEETGGSSK